MKTATLRWGRIAWIMFSICLCSKLSTNAQISSDTIRPVKGSYLHYGHAAIEDNSMFLEEAFNQGEGVLQFISGTLIVGNNVETAFELEIPLGGESHQLSFGSSYFSASGNHADQPEGLGDIRIGYRPQLSGKHHWAMVIPRLTLSIPRRNDFKEFQYAAPNVELAIAVTKRLSKKLTSHLNAGTAYRFKEHSNRFFAHTVAGSVIWAARQRFNFLLESVCKISSDEIGNHTTEVIINPAFRFSFPLGHYQVIPGIGAPVCMAGNSELTTGAFLYLSIEPF